MTKEQINNSLRILHPYCQFQRGLPHRSIFDCDNFSYFSVIWNIFRDRGKCDNAKSCEMQRNREIFNLKWILAFKIKDSNQRSRAIYKHQNHRKSCHQKHHLSVPHTLQRQQRVLEMT